LRATSWLQTSFSFVCFIVILSLLVTPSRTSSALPSTPSSVTAPTTADRSCFLHRSWALFLAVVALGLLPLDARAQSDARAAPSADEAPQTAYLVRSADMLPVVLMSARTSLSGEGNGFSATAADVVVVGPAVKALSKDGPHTDALASSLKAGVRIVACEIAMDKVGVASKDLVDGIDTAHNGFHEILRLESEGYVTLQL
jgi:hypothetical protein